jgi:NPCBM/NEW2 domain
MSHRWMIAYVLSVVAVCGSETPPAPVPAGVDLARAVTLTKAWEDDQPKREARLLRVVYWTPADREPAPGYRERLTRVMRYTQEFYASQMASYGFGRKTVNLEMEADGLLKLRVVRGPNPFLHYRRESGSEIRKDCVAVLTKDGVTADDETLVIFCNLATWDADKRTMRQSSPYYAGGDHRKGTAWQVDSPLLDPELLGEKTAMLQDGEYGKISVGRYNSIFVGGVVHELGHALGLPHCAESPQEKATRGTALMGSGNRTMGEEVRGEGKGTFLNLGDALRLLTHVQFSGSVKGMTDRAEVTWKDLAVQLDAQGAAVISGTVTGKIPVYGVIAYGDPTGGGDYDAQIGGTVPDADGHFRVVVTAPPANKGSTGEFRLIACCVNGAKTSDVSDQAKPSFPFALAQGTFDLTPAISYLGLLTALDQVKAGTPANDAGKVLDVRTQDILRRLLASSDTKEKPEPAALPATLKTSPLSDTRPQSAKTGWGGVHYDRLPPQSPLMCGGTLFVHGIYAHADAQHIYRLGKAWTTLSGSCGIGDDGYGPVEFIILGDGKELWRSGEVKPGPAKSFSVPVTGVSLIELQTKVTAAGAGGAWGVWLEPLLLR